MLEVLRQDYICTAWSKGLLERSVILRHALKNAIIPVVTLVGMQLPILVGGSVIIENIFNLPGLGRLMLDALNDRDYPVVSAVNLFFATAVVFVNHRSGTRFHHHEKPRSGGVRLLRNNRCFSVTKPGCPARWESLTVSRRPAGPSVTSERLTGLPRTCETALFGDGRMLMRRHDNSQRTRRCKMILKEPHARAA